MTTLYTACAGNLTLAQALVQAGVEGGCALLTAPATYHIARVHAGVCETPAGVVDLNPVFEARVFTPQVELRWVEAGHAVVLTEEERLLPPDFPDRLDPMRTVATLSAHYLVWGHVTRAASGWVNLRSRRVGTLALPMANVTTDAVRLIAREYVVTDEIHGNAYVSEERLIGFEPYSAEGAA
ncbi:CRISPR-associated protein Csx19 [Nonomuraea angiospora]|uniref:type III-D CRISPR-associated protein Csx19 n=1 Tax=Nonomuraea angiospora TaxID=46172 RepID=UPI0029B203E3|nr:CRISPR-associated protein Csx19 [Nonomuraea angiospora]MDX3099973.1 CRISPR-associated protein Csx19 [Nonomuraea angiospora]